LNVDDGLRRVLCSRFVVVPLVLAFGIGGWNAWIALHNDGLVRGRVLTADGAPVAGAVVRIMEQNFTTNSERGNVVSGADGAFLITDNRSHNIQLRAEKDGVGRSEQKVVRLFFRAQNVTLDAPLVLQPLLR
jgi:hypothetical protein